MSLLTVILLRFCSAHNSPPMQHAVYRFNTSRSLYLTMHSGYFLSNCGVLELLTSWQVWRCRCRRTITVAYFSTGRHLVYPQCIVLETRFPWPGSVRSYWYTQRNVLERLVTQLVRVGVRCNDVMVVVRWRFSEFANRFLVTVRSCAYVAWMLHDVVRLPTKNDSLKLLRYQSFRSKSCVTVAVPTWSPRTQLRDQLAVDVATFNGLAPSMSLRKVSLQWNDFTCLLLTPHSISSTRRNYVKFISNVTAIKSRDCFE
jgi:hypothetical protein